MKRLPLSLIASLPILTGCATVKNPGPTRETNFTEEELKQRIELVVHVERPEMSDLDDMIPEDVKWAIYQSASRESKRLEDLLRQCNLFTEVVSQRTNLDRRPTVTIKPLPRKSEYTGFDDPMILIYGGIFPLYYKENHGVAFSLKESNSEFRFEYTTEAVVGLIAPAMSASSKSWSAKTEDETYWNNLRAELLKFFRSYLSNLPQRGSSYSPSTSEAGACSRASSVP